MKQHRLAFVSMLALAFAGHARAEPPDVEQEWQPFVEVKLPEGRSVEVTSRLTQVTATGRRNYRYRIVVRHKDGRREEMPWQPIITELEDSGRSLRVLSAEWQDEGYLTLVFRDWRRLFVRTMDARLGPGRPTLPKSSKTLVDFSPFEGPAVESVTFSGSVARDTFVVTLHGKTPKREGEILRAALRKQPDGNAAWVLERVGEDEDGRK